MAKHSIQITDSKLYENIVEYCKENGLKVSFLCTDMLRKQFLIEKFGDVPFGSFGDHSITYDDKIVTSAVINTGQTDVPAVVFEETIDKDSGETTVKAIRIHKCPEAEQSVITVPWVSVGCLTDEEKEKFGVKEENPCTLINTSKIKEAEGKYNEISPNVSNKFYSEITVESVEKAAEEIAKQTTKPKKRRL